MKTEVKSCKSRYIKVFYIIFMLMYFFISMSVSVSGEDGRVEAGQPVTVGDITVEYEDGTPVEDGVVFDLFDMSRLFIDPAPQHFTVKDGKLSGIIMNAEVQYKLGFDTSNEYWHSLDVTGAYKSKKLVRLYARYNGQPPLLYDYDEGTYAPEQFVDKLVIHKLGEDETAIQTRPTSCIMNLMISDSGYAAEGGLPFSLVRRDNNKKKTVYSYEGELCLNGDAEVPYELVLEENPTYVMDERVLFTIKMDSKGCYQAVIDGYDVEDEAGRLPCKLIELRRIDGKETPHIEFPDEDEEAPYSPGEYQLIYETSNVTLSGFPVYVMDSSESSSLIKEPVSFEFYNSTLQRTEGTYTTEDGVLPDIELVRNHHYMITLLNSEYEMPNYYISLSKSGDYPTCVKCYGKEDGIYLTKRGEPVTDTDSVGRVHYELPVYYKNSDNSLAPVSDVEFRLVSPEETIKAVSNESGNLEFDLKEDRNYMVLVDNDMYSIESFPLTIKDKSEYGSGKYTFNHFSCGSVNALYLVDKGKEHDHDTLMLTPSKKTTVTGLHFGNGNYFITDRQLDNSAVSGVKGNDYEVFAIEAINMYRVELSKLAAGKFTVKRRIPDNKSVAAVYYVDDNGKLVPLEFEQDGDYVTFVMPSISMYLNVIEYRSKAADRTVDKATVNVKTVNAKAINAAVRKAGADKKHVTTIVLGKKVRKISKNAFKSFRNVKTLQIRTRHLKKASVKKSLAGSRITKVRISVGSKKADKKYVKRYKKIFTRKNIGKKVKVL